MDCEERLVVLDMVCLPYRGPKSVKIITEHHREMNTKYTFSSLFAAILAGCKHGMKIQCFQWKECESHGR